MLSPLTLYLWHAHQPHVRADIQPLPPDCSLQQSAVVWNVDHPHPDNSQHGRWWSQVSEKSRTIWKTEDDIPQFFFLQCRSPALQNPTIPNHITERQTRLQITV